MEAQGATRTPILQARNGAISRVPASSGPNQGVLVSSDIQVDGIERKRMKLDDIPKWVRVDTAQVPPDQSRANRSGEQSAGKPGHGSPQADGSRVQALY
jgi:hypothetical protein